MGDGTDERRRLSRIEGETLVCTHGNAESRYEAQTSKRTSAKAAEELEKNYK